jgi:hypothetical protein
LSKPLGIVDHTDERPLFKDLRQQAESEYGQTDDKAIGSRFRTQSGQRRECTALRGRQALPEIKHRRAKLMQADPLGWLADLDLAHVRHRPSQAQAAVGSRWLMGGCEGTDRPPGSSSPVSSKTITPLQRRLHPCSGWNTIVRAASWSGRSAGGQ